MRRGSNSEMRDKHIKEAIVTLDTRDPELIYEYLRIKYRRYPGVLSIKFYLRTN